MKYLCMGYGDEKGWNALSRSQQETLLAQDEVLRQRGDMVAMVQNATTIQVMDNEVVATPKPFTQTPLPLAGFAIIEADSMDEVIALVSKTPCARASGAVEIWPIVE